MTEENKRKSWSLMVRNDVGPKREGGGVAALPLALVGQLSKF